VRLGLIPAFLLVLLGAAHAQDMKPPSLSFAEADWGAAIAALADVDLLGPVATTPWIRTAHAGAGAGLGGPITPALTRLNAAMAQRLTGIATSPVPVLLPYDVEALLRDQAAGTAADGDERYLAGFHAARFFYPGPAGYDAAFAIRTADVAELSDIPFSRPIEVQISGSLVLYNLDPPIAVAGSPVPELEREFPGIRRMILEHHLRYTFVRFGVPYVVSALCFDGSVSREGLPTCRAADRVMLRFLHALRLTGGMPSGVRAIKPLPVERPAAVSTAFGYYAPGQILSGSGSRKRTGRTDSTVYSQIRFPLADAPAFAGSELLRRDRDETKRDPDAHRSYSWRDNFCERRSFPVAQCPAGTGHQGQDVRALRCKLALGTDRCERRGDVVAVRGGVILRSPKQEAAYLFVNSANEHIRFRYLHMSPHKMDADGLLSGRRVHEGEIIGEVSNFSMQDAGTSYHLHFDIQVPTKDGWVFVNPYMTLVAAYERLIGARGTELADPIAVDSASTNADSGAASSSAKASRAVGQKRRPRKSEKPTRHRNGKR
jgi:hypothetical protein